MTKYKKNPSDRRDGGGGLNRAARLWGFLRRHRRQLAGAGLALALVFGYVAVILRTVAMAGQSEDPAAPAAMIALFLAGAWFLKAYILRAIRMLLGHPWFNRVFRDGEQS